MRTCELPPAFSIALLVPGLGGKPAHCVPSGFAAKPRMPFSLCVLVSAIFNSRSRTRRSKYLRFDRQRMRTRKRFRYVVSAPCHPPVPSLPVQAVGATYFQGSLSERWEANQMGLAAVAEAAGQH